MFKKLEFDDPHRPWSAIKTSLSFVTILDDDVKDSLMSQVLVLEALVSDAHLIEDAIQVQSQRLLNLGVVDYERLGATFCEREIEIIKDSARPNLEAMYHQHTSECIESEQTTLRERVTKSVAPPLVLRTIHALNTYKSLCKEYSCLAASYIKECELYLELNELYVSGNKDLDVINLGYGESYE